MRLKAIKLAGFKSFVDPTTVSFPSNMSAIVGPNGCGKSNIIDAVRWVMGESSAKHLRGESMTDVIFNGSTARKPVGQASIELIFDNTQGKLVGEYAAFSEISVKRRVTREGQSQYFLNGSKCRRKDVTDLFLGTGLGPRSYAIIEQGMISRLIESKPEELRIFIEEAAGISRYKERRKETESRIRRTQENLERLRDVREELDRQLEKLRRQARDAERYKALKGDERALTARLTALRWAALDEQVATAEAATAEVEARLEDELNARLTLDGQREARLQEQDDQSRALDEAQQRYFDTQSRIARLEQRIQNASERRQQLEADKQALEKQLEELAEEEALERETLSQLQEELGELEPELEELRFVEEEKALALEDAEVAMHAWQERWDAFNAETSELKHAAERAQADVQQQEQRLEDLKRRRQRIDEMLDSLALDETETALRQAEEEAEACKLTLERLRVEKSHSQEALTENEQALELTTDQLNALNQQISTLEGERASLQTLLESSQSESTLSAWAEASGIALSPLLDQVRVEGGWDAAVEAVLDRRLSEARVLQGDWPSGWPEGTARLVRESASQSVGSATESATEDALIHHVTAPDAVYDWLRGARTASDFESAMSQRDALSPGEFWVTPDGHQVGREWVIRSGQSQDDSLLVRKRRLESVGQQLDALASEQRTLEESRKALTEARTEYRHAVQAAEEALQQAQQDEASLMARVESLRSRCDQMRERRAQLEEERDELMALAEERAMALEMARSTWDEAVAKLEAVAERREKLLDERDQARNCLDECKSAHRHARERVHQLQLQITTLRSRCEGLKGGLEKTALAIGRVKGQMAALEEQQQALETPGEDLKDELDRLLDVQSRQEQALEDARRRMEAVQHALRELEARRHENEQTIQTLRNQLEERRLNTQALTLKRNQLREQLNESGFDLQAVLETLTEDDRPDNMEEELAQIAARIQRLGSINLAAIEEFEQQQERKKYLDEQAADLEEALATLEEAIRKIDRETRARFKETFDTVNEGLQRLFPKVFGGGSAYLELTGDDLLETGVAIMARPPGKKNSTIHLLSGGEKALTAIALVFAIFQLNPAPFCMLDEVDAPLDDANVGRYAAMVKEMSEQVQFIYITHNKLAMEAADQLMGVTMHEPGVSRLVAVDVDEAVALAAL